ncbi:hypothetical protein GCM10010390_40460 [Streptomyces mordarskii]|uniref:Uncharacterized protein n=1 Tax=Streptomyces mordarskii TaxID=1226758 RepID=A0ABP3N389_9ACTN
MRSPAADDTTVGRRSAVSLISRLHHPRGQSNAYPNFAEAHAMGAEIPAPRGGYLLVGHDHPITPPHIPKQPFLSIQREVR